MHLKRIRNLRRRIQRLRLRKANVRYKQLTSLTQSVGRESVKRGKHPTFEMEGRPPLTIPNHPGSLSPITVDSILDMLEADLDFQEGLQDG